MLVVKFCRCLSLQNLIYALNFSFQIKGDMKCVVLFKKDVCVVLFKKDVVWFCLKRKLRSFWENSVRETVCRGKLWAIKRGERLCLQSCKDNKCHGKLEGNASKV